MTNFDHIARYYDFLAKMVFGMAIVKAQTRFLNTIKPKSKILIVGGGTGWILEEIDKYCSRCSITYLEASSRMNEISQKRKITTNQVKFICSSSFKDLNSKYDVVITNFYLDLYQSQDLKSIVGTINNLLDDRGIWIVTDFQISRSQLNRIWNELMLSLMYIFFRVTAGLKTTKLPDIKALMQKQRLTLSQEYSCYSGFIFSGIFKKESASFHS